MSFWETIDLGSRAVSAVTGFLGLFGDDEPQGPNPRVVAFSYEMDSINAAEDIRQKGIVADHLLREGRDIEQQAGVTQLGAAALRLHAGTLWERTQALNELNAEEVQRRYGAANAIWERTSAYIKADVRQADATAKAAKAVAGAAAVRAQVAIRRANIKHDMAQGALKLGQAQAGLRGSSFEQHQGAHLTEMRDLTVKEQRAALAAAGARAAAAGVAASVAETKGTAALDFARGEHARSMSQAATWYEGTVFQNQQMAESARQMGVRAAGMDAQVNQALTAATGKGIEAGFMRTAAAITQHGLDYKPPVTEYGGDERFFSFNRGREGSPETVQEART